jgi:hypothetical protein
VSNSVKYLQTLCQFPTHARRRANLVKKDATRALESSEKPGLIPTGKVAGCLRPEPSGVLEVDATGLGAWVGWSACPSRAERVGNRLATSLQRTKSYQTRRSSRPSYPLYESGIGAI